MDCKAGEEKKGATPTSVKWDACQKVDKTHSWKVTGANSMMVGTAAALAFVASQF